jgi:hypothetical protein
LAGGQNLATLVQQGFANLATMFGPFLRRDFPIDFNQSIRKSLEQFDASFNSLSPQTEFFDQSHGAATAAGE